MGCACGWGSRFKGGGTGWDTERIGALTCDGRVAEAGVVVGAGLKAGFGGVACTDEALDAGDARLLTVDVVEEGVSLASDFEGASLLVAEREGPSLEATRADLSK